MIAESIIEYPDPHISYTSKMDGVPSWSLEAIDTCLGAFTKGGSLVPVCMGCYATVGFYRMNNVITVRRDNKKAWLNPEFVNIMVKKLDLTHYMRWFDSGDMYSLALAHKIYEIMLKTPWVKHWLPTKMYKFPKFLLILNKMKALPNVSVRFSADSIDGTYTKGRHGSVVIPSIDSNDPDIFICKAYENGGKCGTCKACYDKSVLTVGYVGHGFKMKKLQRAHINA